MPGSGFWSHLRVLGQALCQALCPDHTACHRLFTCTFPAWIAQILKAGNQAPSLGHPWDPSWVLQPPGQWTCSTPLIQWCALRLCSYSLRSQALLSILPWWWWELRGKRMWLRGRRLVSTMGFFPWWDVKNFRQVSWITVTQFITKGRCFRYYFILYFYQRKR